MNPPPAHEAVQPTPGTGLLFSAESATGHAVNVDSSGNIWDPADVSITIFRPGATGSRYSVELDEIEQLELLLALAANLAARERKRNRNTS